MTTRLKPNKIRMKPGDQTLASEPEPFVSVVGRGRLAYLWVGGRGCFATLDGVRLHALARLLRTRLRTTKPGPRKATRG